MDASDSHTPPPGGPPDAERAFRELADFAPVMIWRARADRACDWFNMRWLEFTGRSLQAESGFGWTEGIHPDDHARCIATYIEAFDHRRRFELEYRLRRHDGEYRWLLDTGAPFTRDGGFAGYFGSCVDITSARTARETQQLLVDQLNHRVKNTLAIVQSLARQTFRDSGREEVTEAFEDRLRALAIAHDLLTRSTWHTVGLEQIIREVLAPWCGKGKRFDVTGPVVPIGSKAAVTLAVAVHELCTNAVRFGALSAPNGRVDIRWNTTEATSRMLQLVWREYGGPPPAEGPRQDGFGSRMLKRALAAEFDGAVYLCFAPSGLVCTISAPLDAIEAGA